MQTESYKKGIVVSSVFVILAQAIAFLANMVIAFYFGTRENTDVYFYGMNTISLISGFIISLNSTVLVPEAMRLTAQESEEQSMRFMNYFILLYFIVGMGLTLILLSSTSTIFSLISSFDEELLKRHVLILSLTAPLLLFMIVNNLLVDIMTSYRYFTMPMVASMINSSLILLFIFIFQSRLDVMSILLGSLLGYVTNFIILVYMMKTRLKWKFDFGFRRPTTFLWKNLLYAQVGTATSTISSYIPLYMFSGFAQGIITALNFGQKTAAIPSLVITAQFSRVFGIKFNELYARKSFSELNRIYVSTAKLLLFLLIPISAFMFFFSDEIIVVLFERGKFDWESVHSTSLFLKFIGLTLAPVAMNTLMARLFMASQKIRQLFWYQVSINIGLIISSYAGIHFFGVQGYLWSLLLFNGLICLVIYFILKSFFPMIRYDDIMNFALLILIINAFISAVLHEISLLFIRWKEVFSLAFLACMYLVLLLVLNQIFKLNPELQRICVDYYRKIVKRA